MADWLTKGTMTHVPLLRVEALCELGGRDETARTSWLLAGSMVVRPLADGAQPKLAVIGVLAIRTE
jgi:hypothetical protein